MLKRTILWVALGPLAGTASADPLPFTIDSIQLGGSGCPGSGATGSVVGDHFLVSFSDFAVSRGDAPRKPSATCTLTMRVHVDSGFSVTLGPTQVEGSATAHDDTKLVVATRLFEAGERGKIEQHELAGEGAFTREDTASVTVRSCSSGPTEKLVSANFSIIAPRPNSVIRLSSATLGLAVEKCG